VERYSNSTLTNGNIHPEHFEIDYFNCHGSTESPMQYGMYSIPRLSVDIEKQAEPLAQKRPRQNLFPEFPANVVT
jgi:hypothetical protein